MRGKIIEWAGCRTIRTVEIAPAIEAHKGGGAGGGGGSPFPEARV